MIRSIFSDISSGIVTLKRSEESRISLISSLDTSLSLSMTSQKVQFNFVRFTKFVEFFRTYQSLFSRGIKGDFFVLLRKCILLINISNPFIFDNKPRLLKLILTILIYTAVSAYSQTDTTKLNMDAVYNRPFLQLGKLPVSVGGYLEANSSYFSSEGISEGLSFQARRMTIFLSSTITKKIKFLSEIEFEDGTKEINIEFASLDVEFHPLFNLRGGIVMNPIGSFNQNHDGPKWEFIERPISSTTIIPSTWSNAGFGIFGKYASGKWVWGYEAYATNGFDNSIISNSENRTWLPASKSNEDRFEESSNGEVLITAKTAFKHRDIGEIGISWMGGVYNKYEEDGFELDDKRRVDLIAIDFNTVLPSINTYINGEWVWASIDVPETFSQQFGSHQQGGFIDIVQPVLTGKFLDWENTVFNIALRLEYTDYNVGKFRETDTEIGDDIYAIVPGISFRPTQQTVVRANFRYISETDLLGNPPVKTNGIQFGFSTYF
ncbi:MAG: hypothetical protein RO257_06665 [Candidatus Kapabacteria bacterium]|nr:hypothetical protein [Candidatus Kapabacteria bacterium]